MHLQPQLFRVCVHAFSYNKMWSSFVATSPEDGKQVCMSTTWNLTNVKRFLGVGRAEKKFSELSRDTKENAVHIVYRKTPDRVEVRHERECRWPLHSMHGFPVPLRQLSIPDDHLRGSFSGYFRLLDVSHATYIEASQQRVTQVEEDKHTQMQ